MGSLGGDTGRQLSQLVGSDEETTRNASGTAMTALLGALQRNSASEEGAAALDRALDRDHDGSMLDNVTSLLGGQADGNGDGILKHLLGDRRGQVEKNLSHRTGMDQASTGKLLTMLAPMVMGALGKQKRQNGLNASAIAGMLSQETEQIESPKSGTGGMIGALLDTDGDGDLDSSDLLKHGAGLLGKLFRRN
jgi:hypothetical protein